MTNGKSILSLDSCSNVKNGNVKVKKFSLGSLPPPKKPQLTLTLTLHVSKDCKGLFINIKRESRDGSVGSAFHCEPMCLSPRAAEHFGFPRSAPRLGNQRPWYVQPSMRLGIL